MKQLSKTCYISDDNKVGCALTIENKYAYIENDPMYGIVVHKIVNSMAEAKEYVLDYEMAIKEFYEVFK